MCTLASSSVVQAASTKSESEPTASSWAIKSSVPVKKPTAFIVDFNDENSQNKGDNLQEAFLKYRNYKMVSYSLAQKSWQFSRFVTLMPSLPDSIREYIRRYVFNNNLMLSGKTKSEYYRIFEAIRNIAFLRETK
jgi:hypothetical protein